VGLSLPGFKQVRDDVATDSFPTGLEVMINTNLPARRNHTITTATHRSAQSCSLQPLCGTRRQSVNLTSLPCFRPDLAGFRLD